VRSSLSRTVDVVSIPTNSNSTPHCMQPTDSATPTGAFSGSRSITPVECKRPWEHGGSGKDMTHQHTTWRVAERLDDRISGEDLRP
jgi:hypothetical protein